MTAKLWPFFGRGLWYIFINIEFKKKLIIMCYIIVTYYVYIERKWKDDYFNVEKMILKIYHKLI